MSGATTPMLYRKNAVWKMTNGLLVQRPVKPLVPVVHRYHPMPLVPEVEFE